MSSALLLPLRNAASRLLVGNMPSTVRAFASAAEELPKPTYTYPSPGTSMREPPLGTGHSLGSPAYFVDPKGPAMDPKASASDTAANLATRAALKPPIQSAGSPASGDKPSYTYSSPGSSIREASYGFSVSDPVYHVDPKPARPAPAKPIKPVSEPHTIQAVSPPPPASKVRMGLVDEYAQQPYVTSPKGSMREPRYVSVSDPQDK